MCPLVRPSDFCCFPNFNGDEVGHFEITDLHISSSIIAPHTYMDPDRLVSPFFVPPSSAACHSRSLFWRCAFPDLC